MLFLRQLNELAAESVIIMKRHKKNHKTKWTYRLLFVLALSMLLVGSYLLLMPRWIRYNQDKIRNQLLDLLDEGRSDEIIWVDPDAWVNSDEEVDYFVPDPSDPAKYIQVNASSSSKIVDEVDSSGTEGSSTENNGTESLIASPTPRTDEASIDPSEHVPTANQTNAAGQIGLQAIGKLVIDKINVNSPIVTGLSRPTLRYAAAHYEITPMIGDRGITAIFAHRHPDHGRDLNRLNEVQAGDQFKIVRNGQDYNYQVIENIVVSPAEVFDYIFGDYNDGHYVMLVTCHPIPTWESRMIVIAKLTDIN